MACILIENFFSDRLVWKDHGSEDTEEVVGVFTVTGKGMGAQAESDQCIVKCDMWHLLQSETISRPGTTSKGIVQVFGGLGSFDTR